MKLFYTVLFVFLFLVGCTHREECYKRVVLDKDKAKCDSFVVNILSCAKVQQRNENEDFDVFIAQAQQTAWELYGTELRGWKWSNEYNSSCKCGEQEEIKNKGN